eukprot:6211804-Pleurochrysis_carterae.AAC.6
MPTRGLVSEPLVERIAHRAHHLHRQRHHDRRLGGLAVDGVAHRGVDLHRALSLSKEVELALHAYMHTSRLPKAASPSQGPQQWRVAPITYAARFSLLCPHIAQRLALFETRCTKECRHHNLPLCVTFRGTQERLEDSQQAVADGSMAFPYFQLKASPIQPLAPQLAFVACASNAWAIAQVCCVRRKKASSAAIPGFWAVRST